MSKRRKEKLTRALTQILHVLEIAYDPEKVIVFGSMAQGNIGEWSDLDLVIIKDTPLPFLQRLKEVALLCDVSVGVDYLVYTPDEFRQMIDEKNPFILDDVLAKGKVVYERQLSPSMA